jgi:ABC-type polysaccharide/polyol phosphate export permease
MWKRLLADIAELLGEQAEYRELLYRMTLRDLKLRYKQTLMGVGWAIFTPLVNTAVFSVVFMRVAPIDTGMPYPLFAYSGLLAWTFTASALRFSVTSLTSNANLVTKVYFPREIFPFSAVVVSLVDAAIASVVLAALMAYYGVHPTPTALLLPIVIVVQVAFTTGIALLLGMGNLFYRDVKYLFEIVLTIWMFVTSVVFPVQLVGGHLGGLLALNPMTPIVDAYRQVLLQGAWPGPAFWITAFVSVIVLAWSWVFFHRSEFEFAESV